MRPARHDAWAATVKRGRPTSAPSNWRRATWSATSCAGVSTALAVRDPAYLRRRTEARNRAFRRPGGLDGARRCVRPRGRPAPGDAVLRARHQRDRGPRRHRREVRRRRREGGVRRPPSARRRRRASAAGGARDPGPGPRAGGRLPNRRRGGRGRVGGLGHDVLDRAGRRRRGSAPGGRAAERDPCRSRGSSAWPHRPSSSSWPACAASSSSGTSLSGARSSPPSGAAARSGPSQRRSWDATRSSRSCGTRSSEPCATAARTW